ncbi:P-loop nucleoside triphosphate hydrolases superfamily protein with CH domain-containing protein [Perilla frutescens var. hirtella]|nr:P-loop nucleoside triphosphate hydrolases superfamily protein with CH domain-containing protein [Perilla frutescens var. hirtella]
MAAIEGALPFSVALVVEDVLQQHGNRSRGLDLDARRAEEDAIRRYEAAAWLRKLIGVVAAKDLPAEPSEEEFRLGLRSGIILCNALNKVQAGAVQKVVEGPSDAVLVPDGAALSAYQYFENVRNFLVAVEEMGMPTFEASDLEQGGKSSRVVNCVLALKSYSDWKQAGGNGVWKFGGNVRTSTLGKQFARKTSEPFTGSMSRSMFMNDKSQNCNEADSNRISSSSLSMLVRAVLLDKKPEEVPNLVESVLSKLVEEFENRMATQIEPKKACFRDSSVSHGNKSFLKPSSPSVKIEQKNSAVLKKDDASQKSKINEESQRRLLNQQLIVDQQEKDVKVLKQTLSTTKAGMQFMQMKFHEEIHNLGLHVHGLAHAASSYHRVLEENRKLYNQVQDLKGNIRVYCRVRPFLPGQFDHVSTVEHIEEGTICINTLLKNGKGRKSFNFNKAFGPSATQEEVFSDTRPLVRSVLDGYNVCIFAYGQTGSGKTFTMTGPRDLTEHSQGVNYRALRDLFILAEQRKDTFFYEVSVQMIEIYNEQVRDLLNSDGLNRRYPFQFPLLVSVSQTGLSVPDASLVRVSSTSDIIDLMNIGQRNRAVGATALNDRSSRSHSCLTVHVQGRDLTSGSLLRGCMHLVDLAGSERVDKSEVTGDRLKEAQHINKSLSALGDVISSLAQKNSHVPYRNSKLTQLLQDSLGGQAKTLMFVHISPEPDAIGETISTLKFAERVATVELGAARVNKDSSDVKELKEQIANLKAALARKDGEPVSLQQKPFQPNLSTREVSSPSPKGLRKPMEDVANVEAHRRAMRQKRQSLDLDELLGNSPSWPPISSPSLTNVDDDREFSSGDWVDKLMVNKQDPFYGVDNPMTSWDQKYLFQTNNQFDANASDDVDELDAGTSDSSEPDLLWQFNHSKLGSFGNGVSPNAAQNPGHKHNKSQEFRSMIPRLGPSPSRKAVNEAGQGLPPPRIGRQATTTETKRKTGSRK